MLFLQACQSKSHNFVKIVHRKPTITSTIYNAYIKTCINNKEDSTIFIDFYFLLEIFSVMTAIAKAISNNSSKLTKFTGVV